MRLIPAWAGKTPTRESSAGPRPAHPRVGGENSRRIDREAAVDGSSPRGRGKRLDDGFDLGEGRLIPAWAGKTRPKRPTRTWLPAHPRVGGENNWLPADYARLAGSSPRGRGKRWAQQASSCGEGLIPAWAGKTVRVSLLVFPPTAHPRVGGENDPHREGSHAQYGSSPRGRGKRDVGGVRAGRRGLIPAWAGKTSTRWPVATRTPAHPRVGGENCVPLCLRRCDYGSSPRGRGKL